MRWWIGLITVLFVGSGLLPTSSGAEPPTHLGAPVQTLVDAVPRVVHSAITEATRDGSPDDAQRLAALMTGYARGFDGGVAWPQDSDAAAWPVDDWLRYGAAVAAVAQEVPPQVAGVARTEARCDAWANNATADEVQAWGQSVRDGLAGLQVILGRLDGLMAAAPPVVDTAPLQDAHLTLAAWKDARSPRVVSCVTEAETLHGLSVPPVLVLQAEAATVWPGGSVVLYGATAGQADQVHLAAAPIGLDARVATDEGGFFRLEHTVPLDAVFGPVVVEGRSSDAAADLTLRVVRVPTVLTISGPTDILPGESHEHQVVVRSLVPALVPTGEVTATGALAGRAALGDGSARWNGTAPTEDTVLRTTFRYAGDALHAPSSRDHVLVVGAAGAAAFQANRLPAPTSDPSQGVVFAALILVGLLAVAALPLVLRRRAPTPGVAWDADTPPTLPPRGPLVVLFAAFHRGMVFLGLARASDTAREMAARLGGADAKASATAFERVRYGRQSEIPEKSAPVVRWLRSTWRRRTGTR